MVNRKEIIWLTENYPPQKGGMAQSCDRIVENLRFQGFQIHIFHFTQRKEAFKPEVQEGGTYTALTLHADESHTLQLAYNHLKKRNLQVGQMVAFGGYLPLLAAPIFKSWLHLELVLMIRGNDFDTSVFSAKRRPILNEAVIQARVITCISREKTEQMQLLFPQKNIQYIPNGIQLQEWQLLKSDQEFSHNWRLGKSNSIVLGCFGHLKAKKGLDLVIQAMNSRALKEAISLLLIGEIDPIYHTRLKEVDINYHLLPFMDRFELIKYYACCDGILIPSHYDGMPNVLLEAGALGLPALAAAKDGMKDVITHGSSGFLFSAGDQNALRQIMFDFIALGKDQRKKMGQELKSTIRQTFHDQNETEMYLNCLN
ncbi:MAG: glycosyltransferase family 4 protein [Candidatus Cyclobacteriaceae bacterium M3_2C_046]